MTPEELKILKGAEKSVDDALEKARKKRNEEDRKFMISAIGKDLITILTPLLTEIAKNSRLSREDIKSVIKEIKVEAPKVTVEAPKVNVETPKAEVKVDVPPIKMPDIKVDVPKANITVKPADVKIPKEMEVKGMGRLLKTIEGLIGKKAESAFGGVSSKRPLNVILTDERGEQYKAFANISGGGVPKIMTIRQLVDEPAGFEQLAISDSAIGLASIPDNATKAIMTVEDKTIRYRTDGSDPDANTGLKVFVGGTIVLNGRLQVEQFKAIRVGTSDSEINVEYYEVI